MKDNVLLDKSFAFAIRITNAYKLLTRERQEFILSKQLLRSGTSVGANAEEAMGAQSRRDFVNKLSIAYKEAREARYWIRLLRAAGYFDDRESDSLLRDVEELLRIMGKIQITTKKSLRNS